jgi:hypothetical protein
MWLLLNIIAEIGKWLLTPIFYVHGCICALRRKEFWEYNKQLALVKDQYGNVLLQYPLNKWFIKPHGYKAGNRKETISSFFGKNKIANTNTSKGEFICDALDALDENHCIKNIDNLV